MRLLARRRWRALRLGRLLHVLDPHDPVVIPDRGGGTGFHPLDPGRRSDLTFTFARSFHRDHCVRQIEPFLALARSADEAQWLITEDDEILPLVEGITGGESNR